MMDSAAEDEQGATASQRKVASTDSGETGRSDETTVDSGLLQPSTVEMLTNEIVNPGPSATVSPCCKASTQVSHDVSPSNDKAQGVHHDTFPGDLESSNAAVETATEERHANGEMRLLKEEKTVRLKEPETSSDDTDDWETASEKSLALDLEPHDPHRGRMEMGSHSQEKYSEDVGLHGPKTISEDIGLHGPKTISEDVWLHGPRTISEDVGLHGPKTISEDVGLHGPKTISEDVGLHDPETISEDVGLHDPETISEDVGLHDPETISEDVGLHGPKTISEDVGLHGPKTISEDVGSSGHETLSDNTGIYGQETVSEDAESSGHDEVCENALLHGHETVGKIAELHSYETVIEESELHSHEMVSKDAWPHGQEAINEVGDLHGLESLSAKTVPFGLEISIKETELLDHGDLETDNADVNDTGSYSQETVSKEDEPRGQEMVNEETGSYSKEKTGVHETVGDLTNPDEETVRELVEPLGNETASDVSRPHGSDADLQGNETVSGVEREEFDEGWKISPYVSAVLDQTTNEIMVTVKEEDDNEETFSPARPDDHYKGDSEEILEAGRDETKSDSTYDEEVSRGTFGDGTYCGHFETRDVDVETVNEDISNVSQEAFPEEMQIVCMERDNDEKQDVYHGIDNHEGQDIYKQTAGENALQETPDSEDTEVVDAGTAETSQRMEEVRSEERITNELSSEEREMTAKVQMKSNEDREHNDVLSEDSRVLEGVTNEDDGDCFCQVPLLLTISKYGLTEATEITDLECERLEEELHSIKTRVGIGEGLLEGLPNMSQETELELQYSKPFTTDDSSYMGYTRDIEAQVDVGCPPLMEEEVQMDYAEAMSGTETKCIESEDRRSTDTQNEPSSILGFGYNAVPEVQVVCSDGHEIGGPCLQLWGLDTERGSSSIDDLSIVVQHQGLGDQEPVVEETIIVEMLDPQHSPLCSQVAQEQSTQEVSGDEPDHHKLEFFPITLKGTGVVSAQDFLPESIDLECMASQESTQESVRESSHQESTWGNTDPATGFNQDLMTPGSNTAETSATNLENIKLLRRQRSNTDPGLIQVQEEKLQASSEGSFRDRLRSITPPCDKFTSTYASTPPKTLEPFTTSLLNPTTGEDKNTHKRKDTSVKAYTFFPTQIFNPMLLLGHAEEESGFYQAETSTHKSMENASQRPLPSPPQDNRVLRHTKNPGIIAVEPKVFPKSTLDASNTKPMLTPSVAPVWLPPQRTRYTGDPSGANEIRTMKPPENTLVRRATIRHKRSNAGAKPTAKRFSNPSLPAIPQKDYVGTPGTSNLPKIQSINVSKIQISAKNRPLPHQPVISEETGQSRSLSSMETVREQGRRAAKEKPDSRADSTLLRVTRREKMPPSDPSQSIQRRYSMLINSSNLLYQEYSDVALNQEIQRQKPGDSPAEDSLPSSPRVRRRILSSQDSYLQRLSISSAGSLWQDIPKIRDSVTFLSMTREEQKLQEAKFELIMSEALYLRSLNIAVDHFQRSTDLQEVMSAQDRQWLFSRLSEVRDASSDFLFDLEEEFESDMYKFQVCNVLIQHEPNFYRVYLPYVTNQSYQDRTFQRLMNDNPRFQQVLSRLESDPVCQRLSLKSFLILPFQRITRMRLLLQNILKRSAPGSAEELQATEAHNSVEKLIRDCNESVQRMNDTEELILLNQKIQFECKIFPLISQSRRLVKHGEVTTLEMSSTSFKSKITTRPVYLHLFSDCLLLSRVREGGRFVVFDHASDVRVEGCEIKLHTNQKNLFSIFLRDSAAAGRERQYIFTTETQSQKLRWICALSPTKAEIDFWRDHGLSQMQCLKSYKARENDELSLEKADILMITQDSDDGWLHGIRLSDQQSGWFPQSNVQPISRNACLRNLQEEQRLQSARAKLQPSGPK